MLMIVFGIHCNFFIVLPIRLKTCRSSFFVLFYKAKCSRPKNRVRLRGFARPSSPDRHRACNLSRPGHVISKFIFNAKIQGPASNLERNKNAIPFVTTYYLNIDNKSLMKTVKNKFKIINNKHLKSIYKDTNFILLPKQPKNLYRELASSRFISNFKNIRKPGTYKRSDKRCKICQIYLDETKKFTMPNVQIWEILREIDCH